MMSSEVDQQSRGQWMHQEHYMHQATLNNDQSFTNGCNLNMIYTQYEEYQNQPYQDQQVYPNQQTHNHLQHQHNHEQVQPQQQQQQQQQQQHQYQLQSQSQVSSHNDHQQVNSDSQQQVESNHFNYHYGNEAPSDCWDIGFNSDFKIQGSPSTYRSSLEPNGLSNQDKDNQCDLYALTNGPLKNTTGEKHQDQNNNQQRQISHYSSYAPTLESNTNETYANSKSLDLPGQIYTNVDSSSSSVYVTSSCNVQQTASNQHFDLTYSQQQGELKQSTNEQQNLHNLQQSPTSNLTQVPNQDYDTYNSYNSLNSFGQTTQTNQNVSVRLQALPQSSDQSFSIGHENLDTRTCYQQQQEDFLQTHYEQGMNQLVFPPSTELSEQMVSEAEIQSLEGNVVGESVTMKSRGRRGRPRKRGLRSKNKVNGKLWEFIRDLLLSDRTNPSFIRWERREDGVFKFVQSDKVAKMWGERKQNPKMTYEKLSRAMRYYYKSKVLLPVFGRRLVYKFGPNATGWLPQSHTGDTVY